MKIVDSKLPLACPDKSIRYDKSVCQRPVTTEWFREGLLLGREETGLKFGTLEHLQTPVKTTGTRGTAHKTQVEGPLN